MRLSALVLSLLIVGPILGSTPVTLTGRVLIQNAGPQTVLAFIETDGAEITHVLRLSAEEAFPQNPVSYHFERAHVEIAADHFVITSAVDRMSVIFAVTPARVDAVRPEASTPDFNAMLLRGYWLSSRSVAPGQCIAMISHSPRIDDACEEMAATSSTDTGPSGGPGAISCSCTSGSSSCTVTCGSGYYACCKDCYVVNGPICKCVRN